MRGAGHPTHTTQTWSCTLRQQNSTAQKDVSPLLFHGESLTKGEEILIFKWKMENVVRLAAVDIGRRTLTLHYVCNVIMSPRLSLAS